MPGFGIERSNYDFEQFVVVTKYDGLSNEIMNKIEPVMHRLSDVLSIPHLFWDYHSEYNRNLRTMFIVLGGDGTMLSAMRESSHVPSSYLLGLNFGKLGFLVDNITLDELYDTVSQAATENYKWISDSRTLAVASGEDFKTIAVNEFLVTTPTRKNPLTYEVWVNEMIVDTQRGDGVIITTPTGSTAYAMSAGGALQSPTSNTLQIVPLAPHTLSSRPIITGPNDRIKIIARHSKGIDDIHLYSDGLFAADSQANVLDDFEVNISTNGAVKVLRKPDWNFFTTLKTKLQWGSA